MSYNALSSGYRAFVTGLDKVHIPKNIQEALEVPEWRAAVMEEMRALEKNETWAVVENREARNLLVANGYLLLSIGLMVLLTS